MRRSSLEILQRLDARGGRFELAHEEFRDSLAVQAAKIDSLAAKDNEIAENIAAIDVLVTATNGRLREVEKWRAYCTGGVAAIPVLGGIIGLVFAVLHLFGG